MMNKSNFNLYIVFYILLISIISSCSPTEIQHLELINAPGAVTDNSVTLIWGSEIPKLENGNYDVLVNGKSLTSVSTSNYKVENLSPDSIYQFELIRRNEKGRINGRSNAIMVRTRPKGRIFNILDYGAVGDGVTLNTSSIQSAIDACEIYGVVVIPKGDFVTGALFVKSNMTLFLEEGAILHGSKNKEDYPVVKSRFEGLVTDQYASVINGGEICGKGIQNFSLRGKGTINGEGETLFISQKKRGIIKRGRCVSIINGENIYLEGNSYIHSPSRAIHLIFSNGITVEGVRINTRFDEETGKKYQITNGDGLTLGSSKNAYIFNSRISSQDDDISLKSGRDIEGREVGKSTEHIRIFDCKFEGGLGVVTGSEMAGGIRDIIVNNCEFENTAFVAQLKAPYPRGNVIENIKYMNISHSDTIFGDNMWFRGAICIDQYYGVETPDYSVTYPVDEDMPAIRDVWFENISVSKKNGIAVYLCGRPEMRLKNINLKNVHAKGNTGFFGRYIDNLNLENVTVEAENGEEFNWVEVTGLKITE